MSPNRIALERALAAAEATVADIRAAIALDNREPPPPVRDLDEISVGEAAFAAGVAETTITRWASRYSIGARTGARWTISRRRLDAHLANRR